VIRARLAEEFPGPDSVLIDSIGRPQTWVKGSYSIMSQYHILKCTKQEKTLGDMDISVLHSKFSWGDRFPPSPEIDAPRHYFSFSLKPGCTDHKHLPQKNLCMLLVQDFLQAGCPSCHLGKLLCLKMELFFI